MYSTYKFASAPQTAWGDIDFISVVSVTASEIVILNSDGSETRLYSSEGDFSMVGGSVQGTVTSMKRTDAYGITTFEQIDRISVSVADILAGGPSRLDSSIAAVPSLLDGFDAIQGTAPDVSAYAPSSQDWLTEPWTAWSPGASSLGYSSLASTVAAAFSVGLTSADGGNLPGDGLRNDVLAGGPGPDLLDGGLGVDLASYAGSASAVTANLADPSANTGDAAGDSYLSVEGLVGSDQSDTLTGDAGGNIIAGGLGDDTIMTGAGDDVIVFDHGDGSDVIKDFSIGGDTGRDSIRFGASTGILSFADLMSGNHLQSSGGQIEIILGPDRIVLAGLVNASVLSQDNFRF